jgi:hypothetical protein
MNGDRRLLSQQMCSSLFSALFCRFHLNSYRVFRVWWLLSFDYLVQSVCSKYFGIFCIIVKQGEILNMHKLDINM